MSWRKKLAIFLGGSALLVSLLLGFIRKQYVIPILMYHSISPSARAGNRLCVSIETFQRQMAFLKKHRYNVIPLAQAQELIMQKKRIPPRTVIVTLDDGYKDNYDYAFAVLKKYRIPATIFVIINEVGRAQNDRLDWEQIRIMNESGLITIGSHCLGAQPLTEIPSQAQLEREIFDSKRVLQERLGVPVEVFSYPEGRFDAGIRQLVQDAGYRVAVATNPGKDYPDHDIFALKRIRISESAKNMFVFWIESTGFYTFMKEHRHK